MYTAGTIAEIPANVMGSGRTLALHMYVLSCEGLHINQAYATAVVLLLIVLVIIVLIYGFTDTFISIFNSEHNLQLLAYAHTGLRLYFLGFLVAGINIVLVAYFSAIDRARPAVLGSVMRGIIAIAFCAILFSQILGLNGIWLSFLGSEIITFFVILIFRKS